MCNVNMYLYSNILLNYFLSNLVLTEFFLKTPLVFFNRI